MIAKVIVRAPNRQEAAVRLAEACSRVQVWPVRTNAAFLARCAAEPDFVAGRVDTGFIAERLDRLAVAAHLSNEELGDFVSGMRDPDRAQNGGPLDGQHFTGFRLNGLSKAVAAVWVNGELREAALTADHSNRWWEDAPPYLVFEEGEAFEITLAPPPHAAAGAASDGQLLAPMPGKVVQLQVKAGERVAKGAPVVTLEAMKMEHGMTAPFDALVVEAPVAVGQQVAEGALLVRLEAVEG